jgi:hypothetical protein
MRQLFQKISSKLDSIANHLEAKGLIKEAYEIDKAADMIDSSVRSYAPYGGHTEPNMSSMEEYRERHPEMYGNKKCIQCGKPIMGRHCPYCYAEQPIDTSKKIKQAASPEIKAIYDETKQLNPGHAATLIGERQRGSKWGESLTEQKLVSLPWEEYRGPKIPGVMQPVARYFKLEDASKYFPGSRQRMESLEDAEKKGYRMTVQQSAHGNKEIVSPDVKDSPIMEAWMVVGPAEDATGKEIPGKEMIWTLFPGVLSGSDPNWDGVIETIPPEKKKYVAVKGI